MIFWRRSQGMARVQTEFPLHGLTIVVTRPRAQAARTAIALRHAGAEVIEFPVLDIAPIEASLPSPALAEAAGIVFVSANAVEFGLPVIARAGKIGAATKLFAIGRATAQALVDAGYSDVVSPQQSIDSEGLLAMPQLQAVAGRHIIIVKGTSERGGRTLLEETLAERGARVTVLTCYRRAPMVAESAAQLILKNSLASGRPHACFALSAETLESLVTNFSNMNISPQAEILLLVPNARVAAIARAHGFARTAEVPLAESILIAALLDLKPRILTHASLPH